MSSTSGWSPLLSSSSRGAEDEESYYLARELDMLERAVREKGQVSRRELGRLVGCRYRGPGRFGRALREAVRQGRLTRPRRGVYGPPG
jgi:Transcriptional regulator, AbiEi antitoxin